MEGAKEYNNALEGLVKLFERVENEVGEENKAARRALGLWGASEGEQGEIGLVDAMAGPCMYPLSCDLDPFSLSHNIGLYRTHVVLSHYRSYTPSFSSSSSQAKYDAYIRRLTSHPSFAKTCTTDELYLDSYER